MCIEVLGHFVVNNDDQISCKCFPLIVFEATIPGLFVSNCFGATNVFWLVETNCLL